MRYFWRVMVLLALVTFVFAGCGGDGGTEGRGGPDATPASDQKSSEQLDPPAAAVAFFLDAVRRGDDPAATSMFTPLAREKAQEIGLAVAPRGSDTASFEVGKVEYLSQSIARVDSTWSDLGENGQRQIDEIQWTVHQEPEGWRVAGLTTTVLPGERPLALNFEDPEDMLRRLEALRTEMARRTQPQALQATQPQVSEDSFRR